MLKSEGVLRTELNILSKLECVLLEKGEFIIIIKDRNYFSLISAFSSSRGAIYL